MKDPDVLYPDQVRSMTEDELQDKLLLLKKEQFNFRFQKASGQLEATAKIAKNRRNIARIKTILQQKRNESSQN